MSDPNKEEILQELRRTNKLLVLIATKGQIQKDAIVNLSRAGFQPKEIADLLGTSAGTVSVTLSISKKRAKGEKGETIKKPEESKSNDK